MDRQAPALGLTRAALLLLRHEQSPCVTSPARDRTTRTKEIPDQRQTETSLATWAMTYAVPVKAAGAAQRP